MTNSDLAQPLADILDRQHKCPFCLHEELFQGPSGGLADNLYCQNCGAGFWTTGGVFPPKVIREPKAQIGWKVYFS